MKTITSDVQVSDVAEQIVRIARPLRLILFGSRARGTADDSSDVDILVAFDDDADWSLYDWVDMIEELKGICGREVHLFSKKGLRNPFRRQKILATREVVYGS